MNVSPSSVEVLITLMRERRQVSAKRLAEPGPSAEQIRTLFEAAAQVPDHGLILPWRFVQVSDAARPRLGGLSQLPCWNAIPPRLQNSCRRRTTRLGAPRSWRWRSREPEMIIRRFRWPNGWPRSAARYKTCC